MFVLGCLNASKEDCDKYETLNYLFMNDKITFNELVENFKQVTETEEQTNKIL